MRYTPKHSVRRPRTRRIAGLTVASAATLVAGLTVTAPAAQAQGGVWDRVAACESGGNWSINTGNGYYGGLQFAQSTWVGYGGQQYASQANLASRSQQISIAQKVLAGQGPGAWPTCSVKAGLTRSNGGASSSAPAPAPKSAPQPAPAPTHEHREQSASRNAPTQKAAPAPTHEHTQKAAPAPTHEHTQKAAPAPTHEHTQKAPVKQVSAPSYTVVSGDTVSKIAARFGSSVSAIVSANGLSDNGRLIFVGDTLVVPGGNVSAPVPTSSDYTVRSGDVLWRIATDQGTSVDAIVAANDLANPDLILPGQTLAIPGS